MSEQSARKDRAARLRAAREKAGFRSAVAAAQHFGWQESGYRHHENGTRGIGPEEAKIYASAFGYAGLTIGDLLGLQDEPGILAPLPIVGEAAMGAWVEEDLDVRNSNSRKSLSVPPHPKRAQQRALYVADDSANLSIQRGEYAIYTPITDVNLNPAQILDKLLYVQQRRKGLVEYSIRKSRLNSDGAVELFAHSNDPRYASVITYPAKDGEVRILGVIDGKHVIFNSD